MHSGKKSKRERGRGLRFFSFLPETSRDFLKCLTSVTFDDTDLQHFSQDMLFKTLNHTCAAFKKENLISSSLNTSHCRLPYPSFTHCTVSKVFTEPWLTRASFSPHSQCFVQQAKAFFPSEQAALFHQRTMPYPTSMPRPLASVKFHCQQQTSHFCLEHWRIQGRFGRTTL